MQRRTGIRSSIPKFWLFIAAVLVFYGGYYWGNRHAPKVSAHKVLRLIEPAVAISSVKLQDQYGNRFTEERFKDHWNLVLFGYTRATETNRETLYLATRVINRLADIPDLQRATRVIFVSLDSEYDTPAVLKTFIDYFSPEFLALTGNPEEVHALASQLGVRYGKPRTTMGTLHIDHSTSIGLIGPDGKLRGLFTGLVDEVSIASDLKQLSERYLN